MTKDGKPYGPERYRQLVTNCYLISKNYNTSYVDVRDKMTPSEMTQIMKLINQEIEEKKKYYEKIKQERDQKKQNRR